MFKPKRTTRNFPTGLILALMLPLLSACAGIAQPATGAPVESPALQATAPPAQAVTPVQNVQTTPLSAQDALATREAALESSGKSGPTLPADDVPQQPGQPTATPTPTSPSVQAETGSAVSPNQATPGDSLATLSPAELATRDAALENSSKPGPTPAGETASPASNCLRGAGLLLLPLAILAIRRHIR